MKKWLMFVVVLCLSVCLSACGKNGNSDNSENSLSQTDLNYLGAEQVYSSDWGSILYVKYSNSKQILSFSDYITVSEGATWSVSFDINGNIPIKSKTTNLSVGDNIYYILVVAKDGSSEQYTLLAHRNYMYTVDFVTQTSTQIDSINVEEGNSISKPSVTLNRLSYNFIGWDWDFSQPITSNVTITAQWEKKATVHIYFRYLSDEVDIIQADDFQAEVYVDKGTTVKEILSLAKIKDFINDVTIKNLEDAKDFIESSYYLYLDDDNENEVIATFYTYYLREYPISHHGYVQDSSLEVETNADYVLNLEYYEIYFVFTLSYK